MSKELRYLVADEAAALTLGRRPFGRVVPVEDAWMQSLGLVLDLFDSVNRGVEAYGWLVTPNAESGDQPPLGLLQAGKPKELLVLTRRHLMLGDMVESRRAA